MREHVLAIRERDRASAPLDDPAHHSAGDWGDPSACGPCTASAKRRAAGCKKRGGSRGKCGSRLKDFHERRLLRVPRARGSRRRPGCGTAGRPATTFLRGVHKVYPPADLTDATVHEQSHFGPRTSRHLGLSAIDAESHFFERYSAAESVKIPHQVPETSRPGSNSKSHSNPHESTTAAHWAAVVDCRLFG